MRLPWNRRIDEALASVATVRPERVPANLTQQERQELQATWTTVCCPHCGYGHTGTCPRVRRSFTESSPNLVRTQTWYWREGEWSIPDGAVSADDVFGTPVPVPPARCEARSVDASQRCELQVGHPGEHQLAAA